MPQFRRALPLHLFTEVSFLGSPWLVGLFNLQSAASMPIPAWAPAPHLHLAICDRSLNSYYDSQSTGKVDRTRDGGPAAYIHAKYVAYKIEVGRPYCRVAKHEAKRPGFGPIRRFSGVEPKAFS